jgi:RNA polymerase sigma-70 factor, ECF subfamily
MDVRKSTGGRRDARRADGVPAGAHATAADFASLYHARFSDLAGQLYAYTGDRNETHDLVQEAFVRAWQRWDTVGRYDDPVAWIRRVAWNLATSRFRRLQVIRRNTERLRPPPDIEATGPDRVALVTALRRIPDALRRVIVLHYLADLSVAEIAAETEVPVGTVKSWLHRARAELARHLDDTREGGFR